MKLLPVEERKILNEKELEIAACNIRRLIIEVAAKSRSAHVGSSLSCVDILTVLYFNELRIDMNQWEDRDIFVLSKGHAAMALYAVLAQRGFISFDTFWGYCQNNGILPAHLDRFVHPTIEVSAGSLGHGFNIALGMSYGYMLKGDSRRVFTLIGDGESEEGSIWEGAEVAAKLGLDNFTAFLDYNNLQGYGRPNDLMHYEPVADKWHSFRWQPYQVNGHDFSQMLEALKKPRNGKPKIIIACTIKGKGVSFMEDQLKWHYFIVTEEIKKQALRELDSQDEK